ncbi:MAG TPA: hypothetical protein DDY59_15885 [Lachnospiraceae bacterium]|jgi:hypothetical protein|nr:hypothetical protein [Lachnospiraceae bacterium]HCA69696.1 hypothetical protein [Lachnospiraceae bacterium]
MKPIHPASGRVFQYTRQKTIRFLPDHNVLTGIYYAVKRPLRAENYAMFDRSRERRSTNYIK